MQLVISPAAWITGQLSLPQREEMELELYNICLHINDWGEFAKLMNHTFNDIIIVMESNYPEMTHKEMMWSCLLLLNTSTPKMLLLLDYKTDSLYKMKQRMVQKMNLKTSKDLDGAIKELTERK